MCALLLIGLLPDTLVFIHVLKNSLILRPRNLVTLFTKKRLSTDLESLESTPVTNFTSRLLNISKFSPSPQSVLQPSGLLSGSRGLNTSDSRKCTKFLVFPSFQLIRTGTAISP
jgi:hypothetical protein